MTGGSPSAPPGVDPDRLAGWLAANLDAGPGVPEVSVISGGRSNLTYLVRTGGHELVLRRPPLGHVLATAHDMAREYRVLGALHGTAVPVPEPLAYCGDTDVIGAPFYLMRRVEGVVYRTPRQLAALAPDDGRALTHALADTLAALHRVDPAAVGLADFGRPLGFLSRQVRRWSTQLAASYTRPLAGAKELAELLGTRLPDSGPATIVHGDFRLDNVIVRPDPAGHGAGCIAAVLDWEMSTLGDPLTDLGVACVYWDGLGGFGAGVPLAPGDLPGWPGRDELVGRYATASGTDVAALDWYIAFAYFKLAVILEGIYCRYTQGLTVGEGFDQMGDAVPELIARGHAALAGA